MGQAIASTFFAPQPPAATGGAQPEGPQNPETTWWCRILARVVGTVAGLVAFLSGIFACITVSPLCIVGGLLLMLASILVLVFEAPIFCTFIDITKPIAAFAEKRTYFQKAIIYVVLAIIPFAMCAGLTTLFGCGLIFAAGVIYGIMGLGRKADRERMMVAAATGDAPPPAYTPRPDDARILINNEEIMRVDPTPFVSGQYNPQIQNFATQNFSGQNFPGSTYSGQNFPK